MEIEKKVEELEFEVRGIDDNMTRRFCIHLCETTKSAIRQICFSILYPGKNIKKT